MATGAGCSIGGSMETASQPGSCAGVGCGWYATGAGCGWYATGAGGGWYTTGGGGGGGSR